MPPASITAHGASKARSSAGSSRSTRRDVPSPRASARSRVPVALTPREQLRERSEWLDAQAALPPARAGGRGRSGSAAGDGATAGALRAQVERSATTRGLAGIAGYTREQYEQLHPRAQREARLEIDRELALRHELRGAAGAVVAAGERAPGRRERRRAEQDFDGALDAAPAPSGGHAPRSPPIPRSPPAPRAPPRCPTPPVASRRSTPAPRRRLRIAGAARRPRGRAAAQTPAGELMAAAHRIPRTGVDRAGGHGRAGSGAHARRR